MASPPSSAPRRKYYDAFLSRSSDTHKGFTSHLFAALVRNQTETFVDNNPDAGEEISPSILEVIEESHVAVVIFSTHYADSERCLDELVKIRECMKAVGQVVIPVFYQVDPTNVQELTGSYEEAMRKHEHRYKDDLQRVESWKLALKEVSNLSGRASWDSWSEATLIDEIVSDTWKKLEFLPFN